MRSEKRGERTGAQDAGAAPDGAGVERATGAGGDPHERQCAALRATPGSQCRTACTDPGAGAAAQALWRRDDPFRSEEHTSELQSLMRISYAVFCLKKKKKNNRKIRNIER